MMKSPTISYKAVALDRLTPREQETIHVIRELNAGYGRAFLHSDTAWYDTMLADDFQCITSAGTRLNKQEFLQRAAQPVSMEDFRFEDVDIRLFGDVAIIHALNPYTSSHGHSGASRYGYLGETPWRMEGGLSAHDSCAGLRPHESLVEDRGAYVHPTTLDTGGTL